MCVVLVGCQEEGNCTQRRTHQLYPRLHASMILLHDGQKEESTMCVVLVGRQQEGPLRRKHAKYLDGLEQSQSWWCKHTHSTQVCTHQRSPRRQASIIMFPNGE